MDCQTIHNRMRQTDCLSIVIEASPNDAQADQTDPVKVIGGLTSKLHSSKHMVELLLIGVQQNLEKKGVGSAAMQALQKYC